MSSLRVKETYFNHLLYRQGTTSRACLQWRRRTSSMFSRVLILKVRMSCHVGIHCLSLFSFFMCLSLPKGSPHCIKSGVGPLLIKAPSLLTFFLLAYHENSLNVWLKQVKAVWIIISCSLFGRQEERLSWKARNGHIYIVWHQVQETPLPWTPFQKAEDKVFHSVMCL